MECLTWQGAQRVAEWLVRGARPGGSTSDAAEFWYGATAKLLAPILLAAACSGGTMAQVVGGSMSQEDDRVTDALELNDEQEALSAFEAIALWDDRTRGSVYATAQTVLIAYVDPGVLASAMTAELRAERLLDGGWHTAYLCAPAHEQRRLQPLFATLVQEIVAHAYDRTTETGKPLDPPLLLVLDECANIAPLRDLATLASTGAGQGIQLVSVFQDMAQIYAVYGRDRAPTIVSNHRAKVILSGIADPQTLEYLARLLGDEEVPMTSSTSGAAGRTRRRESVDYRHLAPANVLREMRPGQGVLVYGHLAPARIALRPWFKDRRLRQLARQPCSPCGGRATVNAILEDLTTLPPKRLEKRLEELARDALPCHSATVFDGNPEDGLTVALHVDSRRRRDVLDLARVVEDDAAVHASLRLVAPCAEPSASVLAPAAPAELRASRDVRLHGLASTSASIRATRFARPCRSFSPRTVSSSTSTAGSTPTCRSSGSLRRSRANACSMCSRHLGV